MYPFIISAVVPRPIAFISSLSKEVSLPIPLHYQRRCAQAHSLHLITEQRGRRACSSCADVCMAD